jgi:hypothetical protein
VISQLDRPDPIMSFRDLVAMSVVPYARSLNSVYNTSNRIVYSNSFWLYPWITGRDTEYLVASTPAFQGVHVVEQFHGQSSPEISVMELREQDIDKPLFEELLRRWKRYYLRKRQSWQDRALFRSLNMANQAAQLPAGVGTILYDLGRMVALWVSAFEILAHPRTEDSGLRRVYPLLERVSYWDRNVGRRRYAAYMPRGKKRKKPTKPSPRRPFPCSLYGKLYQARCDFLHGNPIHDNALHPNGSKLSLFWVAPVLYRLALTGFLELPGANKRPKGSTTRLDGNYLDRLLTRAVTTQNIMERALLQLRSKPAATRRNVNMNEIERIDAIAAIDAEIQTLLTKLKPLTDTINSGQANARVHEESSLLQEKVANLDARKKQLNSYI